MTFARRAFEASGGVLLAAGTLAPAATARAALCEPTADDFALVDLKGLPPAFIGVRSIDLFVDEDVDYAHRPINSGTPTEPVLVPGAFHGFDAIAAQTRRRAVHRCDAGRTAEGIRRLT